MHTGQIVVPRTKTNETRTTWFTRSAMPSIGLAVASIWGSVLVASLFSPSMVTGSNHEQLAIVAMADWVWGTVATALLLLAGAVARHDEAGAWPVLALVTATIWIVVALVSVFAPTFVTGTDPTTIPLAAILAPIAGLIATAFVSVFAAGAASRGAAA